MPPTPPSQGHKGGQKRPQVAQEPRAAGRGLKKPPPPAPPPTLGMLGALDAPPQLEGRAQSFQPQEPQFSGTPWEAS